MNLKDKNNVCKFSELYNILKMDRQKSEWSKKQTEQDRLNYLLNEIKELKAEIDKNNENNNLKVIDEAGDVFWNLLAMIIILEEKYDFEIDDLIEHIIQKIKRRKPKIFEHDGILKEEDELKDWYEIKEKEA